MDMFHKIQELIDRNTEKLPEGDYLELCNTLHALRQKVQPPSFMVNQNEPMTIGSVIVGSLDGDEDEDEDEDEDYYVSYADATLSEYVHQLHAEWSSSVVSQ
jgi:hypothetical protein